MLRLRVQVVALSLTLALASPVAAQGRFAVSGYGGAFFATSDLISDFTNIGILDQETGFAFGGRLGWWPLDRLGIEAEGGLAISKLRARVPQVGEESLDATVWFSSLNLLYAIVKPPLEPLSIYISGGVGLLGRQGDGWDFQDIGVDAVGLTDIAGVLGFGLRYGVARGVNLSADVRDYISSFKLELETLDGSPAGETDAKLQNDLMITAGVELIFGGI